MKTTMKIALAALLAASAGCGPATPTKSTTPGGPTDGTGQQVNQAAANKFNAGLEAMAAHDKAQDWKDEVCTQVAQMFLDAAKEQTDRAFNEAFYDAGLAYQRCKKATEAKALFKQILDKDPKFNRAKVQMALYAYADSGEKNVDETITSIRDAVVDSHFELVDAMVTLGMLYIKRNNSVEDQEGKNDLGRAKLFIQRALAKDDSYMPAFNQLAIMYLETAKQAAGADSRRKVRAGGSKEKKLGTGALELAALVCSQGIRKNPKYASIHNTAGMIQVELGNLNDAVGQFNQARTLDPSFFEAQMNFAAVNLTFRGFGPAEQAYRKALEIRPNDYDAHLGLALALRGAIDDSNFDRNVKEAADELGKAKTIAPDRPETYYNEAILTQEYKAKGGGEPELLNAKKLFGDFVAKAGSAPEFADAVKRSKDRMGEIDQIIAFAKQSAKEQKAAAADAKQKAAEAEAAEGAPAGEAAPAAEKKE